MSFDDSASDNTVFALGRDEAFIRSFPRLK